MRGVASAGTTGRAALLLAPFLACSTPPDTEVGIYVPLAQPEVGASAGGALATGGMPELGAGGELSAGGSPGADGTGGIVPVETPPDIHFEWTETEPVEGECLPGVYTGEFQCQWTLIETLPSTTVSGPVTFTLSESQDGEFLEIVDGALIGLAGPVLFASELQGRLDCATGSFEAISINGQFTGGTFSGTLLGTLNRATLTLSGAWSLASPNISPCVGLWSVRRTP